MPIQVTLTQLEPGMFLVAAMSSAHAETKIYREKEGMLTEDMIQALADEGYDRFYIDILQSADAAANQGIDAAGHGNGETEEPIDDAGSSPVERAACSFAEEVPRAVKIQDASVAYMRQCFFDIHAGKVNFEPAAQFLEDILGSLERNPATLPALMRMRATDKYLYRHCVNVCVLTMSLALYLGKDREDILAAGFAGLFHDLGKALVPAHILKSSKKLNQEEFSIMKRHPMHSFEQLLSAPDVDEDVLNGVLFHHERHNGSGYPNGLAGDAIPELARFIAIADIFDALSSRRPHKGAMYPYKVLCMLYAMRGKELLREDIAAFIRMLGVYPVGSVLELEDGSLGVVIQGNAENQARPVVSIVRAPDGTDIRPPKECNLAEPESPAVARCLPKEAVGISPEKILGIPVF